MKICSIVPVDKTSFILEDPMLMCLTHLVEKYPREYGEKIRNRPKNCYAILDNSLIELGGALSMERLVKAAFDINADEIILPDVFKDGKATLESTKKSIEWLKQNKLIGKFKLMAVCHGKTKEEFEECFKGLSELKELDVIGIPKVMSSFDWVANRSRASLYDIFKDYSKEIHFLGSWYNLEEIYSMPKECWDRVRSADTCLPSLYVIQKKNIWEDREGTINLEYVYPELTREAYNNVMRELESQIIKHQLY